MGRVFISYVREDVAMAADRLYETLAGELGANSLFMDIDDLSYGENWKQVVTKNIEGAVAMVVVMGSNWKPTPSVQFELLAAFANRILVIPVVVAGADFAALTQDLAPNIARLRNLNAAKLDRASWQRDVRPLIDLLRKATTVRPPAPLSPHEPGPLATLNYEPSYYDRDELMRHAEELAEWLDDPTIVSSARLCYEDHNSELVPSNPPTGRPTELKSRLIEVIRAGRQRLHVEQSILSLLKFRPAEKGAEKELVSYAKTLAQCLDDPSILIEAQQELEDFRTAVDEYRYGGMTSPREPQKELNSVVDRAMERVANEIPGITMRHPNRSWPTNLPSPLAIK